jgi:hypothetical protein
VLISTVPAPQKSGEDQAIGRSRGGLGTKIHTMVDALGNPLGFHLTGGEAHDLVGADHLLPDMQADTLIADKAFDADERVIKPLAAAGKACDPVEGQSAIASGVRSRSLQGAPPDPELLRQTQTIPRHRHSL